MKKVGILGGTFNPIHQGHLFIAEYAQDEYQLDQVWIMPSGVSYLKRNLSIPSAEIRSAMVSLAIQDNPHFKLSDIETKRAGNTYTSETLIQLTEENPDTEFYFIIGADTLFSIEHWKDVPIIFSHCHVLVAVRNDSSLSALQAKKEEYECRFQAKIELMQTPNIELSSENIRKRVKEGHSIRYYVPKAVEEYICENQLYLMDDVINEE